MPFWVTTSSPDGISAASCRSVVAVAGATRSQRTGTAHSHTADQATALRASTARSADSARGCLAATVRARQASRPIVPTATNT